MRDRIDRLEVVVTRVKTYESYYPHRPPLSEDEKAALPDMDDLRMACETIHIIYLRGQTSLKLGGRNISETAKALLMYHKIPKFLIPRFPIYQINLKDFDSLRVLNEFSNRNQHCNIISE